MNKQPLLTTGLNGLVGSKFAQLYQNHYQFDNLDLRDPQRPVDITDDQTVMEVVSRSSAETLIHLAAFTNVDAAWEQRGSEQGLAYQVNVEGTRNIVQACQETGKKLIHISTAYVFDGKENGRYTEEDTPNPIEWYGQTKWEAEQIVVNSGLNWVILRIDQPFRPNLTEKPDFAHKITAKLQSDQLYPMFTDHYFSPTYIPDFSRVMNFFVQSDQVGLFHATSGEKWTDYRFAQMLKDVLKLPGSITAGTLNDYLATLDRPYQKNTCLDCSKLKETIDFDLTPIRRAVEELKI